MEKYSGVERWDSSPRFACCPSADLANGDCPFYVDTCLEEKFLLFLKARWPDVVVHDCIYIWTCDKQGEVKGSGSPVSREYLFLREKALVKVQRYFHAVKLQILLLSKKRGEKGLLKAFKNNKNCLFNKCSFACLPTAQTILSRTVICLGFPMLNKTSTKHKFENRLQTLHSLAAYSPAHKAGAQG